MGTNLELRELYVKLGTLQNQKSAVADMAFEAAVNVDDNGIGPAGDAIRSPTFAVSNPWGTPARTRKSVLASC